GGGNQGADGCPAIAAAIRSREQVILATEGHGPYRALDGIVVEIHPAIVEEPAEGRPAGEGIADGVGKTAIGWNAAQFLFEPELHGLDDGPRVISAGQLALVCRLAPDGRFNLIELGDTA